MSCLRAINLVLLAHSSCPFGFHVMRGLKGYKDVVSYQTTWDKGTLSFRDDFWEDVF